MYVCMFVCLSGIVVVCASKHGVYVHVLMPGDVILKRKITID